MFDLKPLSLISPRNVTNSGLFCPLFFLIGIYRRHTKSRLDYSTRRSNHLYIKEAGKASHDLTPVVQRVDSTIHCINHYPMDNSINFDSTYPLDSDLSSG